MQRFSRCVISLAASVILSSCGSISGHRVADTTPSKRVSIEALVKREGKYAWRFQVTATNAAAGSQRTLWFTMPRSNTLPVELCTDVSVAGHYKGGSQWIQPSGPLWSGYVVFNSQATPPTLELRFIEKDECACQHFGKSEFDGIHPVRFHGHWRKPER